jgi:phosphocarrier protein HPr
MKTHPYAPLLSAVMLAEKELDRHLHPPVEKLEKEIALVNRFGLHMRPAAMFARTASGFHSDICVAKDENEVDGKSVMSLISLAAAQGAKLRIRIEGRDANQAMRELERLIQSRFEED